MMVLRRAQRIGRHGTPGAFTSVVLGRITCWLAHTRSPVAPVHVRHEVRQPAPEGTGGGIGAPFIEGRDTQNLAIRGRCFFYARSANVSRGLSPTRLPAPSAAWSETARARCVKTTVVGFVTLEGSYRLSAGRTMKPNPLASMAIPVSAVLRRGEGRPRRAPLGPAQANGPSAESRAQVLWLPVQVPVQAVVLSMSSDLPDSGSSRRSRSIETGFSWHDALLQNWLLPRARGCIYQTLIRPYPSTRSQAVRTRARRAGPASSEGDTSICAVFAAWVINTTWCARRVGARSFRDPKANLHA